MKELKTYSIPFVGLKKGLHRFTYDVTNTFFTEFEYNPFKHSNLLVDLLLDKKEDFFILNFNIEGTVTVECDRCLEDLEMPVNTENKIIVKFDDTAAESDPASTDIVFIPRLESHINVAHWIYEFVNLSLPLQKIHPVNEQGESMCNKKVLNILKQLTPHKNEDIDPRWDALNKLRKSS